jgi:hypothetical protein
MNDTIKPESHDRQPADEPHLNWDRKVPQGEDAPPEETDPFLGVTNEMFLDALDAMVRKKVARDSKVDFPITVMRVRPACGTRPEPPPGNWYPMAGAEFCKAAV